MKQRSNCNILSFSHLTQSAISRFFLRKTQFPIKTISCEIQYLTNKRWKARRNICQTHWSGFGCSGLNAQYLVPDVQYFPPLVPDFGFILFTPSVSLRFFNTFLTTFYNKHTTEFLHKSADTFILFSDYILICRPGAMVWARPGRLVCRRRGEIKSCDRGELAG